LLEKNGKTSSRKRHINILYFFVNDKYGKGKLDTE